MQKGCGFPHPFFCYFSRYLKIYILNREKLQKLTKNQLMGREVIKIDGKEGYLDGKGYWSPGIKSNK